MIELLQMDLAQIERARAEPGRFDHHRVIDGGLPPPSILDGAARSIGAGQPVRWFAPFLFIEPKTRSVVGSAIFKGAPSAGWVEIGYGVAGAMQRRGHATDAVFALVRVAFDRPDVHTVYAETSIDNVASRRVVQKVGFTWAGQRHSDADGPVDCWFVGR